MRRYDCVRFGHVARSLSNQRGLVVDRWATDPSKKFVDASPVQSTSLVRAASHLPYKKPRQPNCVYLGLKPYKSFWWFRVLRTFRSRSCVVSRIDLGPFVIAARMPTKHGPQFLTRSCAHTVSAGPIVLFQQKRTEHLASRRASSLRHPSQMAN
jgi:hypothetical protein